MARENPRPTVSAALYDGVMSEITYVRGDATVPSVKGVKVIAHVYGGAAPRRGAGNCATSQVRPMEAHRPDDQWRDPRPTQRSAVPRIGCGLAGGKWSRVEPLVRERLAGRGIAVTVYDHGEGRS